MTEITRVGLDLAKNVFEVHAVNAQEQVVVRRSLRRSQVLTWFAKQPALPDRHRGMWHGEPLGTRIDHARSHRPPDPTRLCQAVCPAEQERRG